MRHLILLLLIFFSLPALALTSGPVKTEKASLELITGGYDNSGTVRLGLHFNLEPGWHIYWRTPGDTGYPPQLDWNKSTNLAMSEILWPTPARVRETITDDFITESYVYSDEVLFPLRLAPINASQAINVNLEVHFAICAELCIPDSANFSLTIPPGYHDETIMARILGAPLPQPNGTAGLTIQSVEFPDADHVRITASDSQQSLAKATMLIEGSPDVVFNEPAIEENGNSVAFTFPVKKKLEVSVESMPLTITLANGNRSVEHVFAPGQAATPAPAAPAPMPSPAASVSLALMLLFGLLGGLILNIMPCVLPVLSIKLLGVIRKSGSNRRDIASAFLITALGIVISFITLALLIILLRNIGMNVGWGFHFQEPLFIIALVVILTFFAANLWGWFEFRLPVPTNSRLFVKSGEDSAAGQFLTGVFATLLATPCTAPFLGTAVGFAINRGAFEIFSVFTAMGIGMASPYLLFSLFPGAVSLLPKPGAWMLTVKKIMGVLLALTAIWLIWVLSGQLGILAAAALLLISLAKLLKLWAIHHKKWVARPIVRHAALALAVVLAFCVPTELARSPDKTTHSTLWQDFAPESIPSLVAQDKVVLVDVTADWCLTCKVNKFRVLTAHDIEEALAAPNIVAMRADWTNKDAHIAQYLMQHNRSGIPFNMVYGPGAPEGIILSELLSKSELLQALEQAQKTQEY